VKFCGFFKPTNKSDTIMTQDRALEAFLAYIFNIAPTMEWDRQSQTPEFAQWMILAQSFA